MALTKISTGGVKDDAASQAKIADEAVDEARLQISNAGTNGQFLSKQSGNTGGLTWAAANEYTHPNHSGEVTSTGDGATVIASNIVDEDNLKVSNTPTNGQLLSAQSGASGGLTWTDPPASAPQIEATADGAITAGDTCIVNTNGTVKKVTATYVEKTPVLGAYTRIITGHNRELIKVGCDTNRNQPHFLYKKQNTGLVLGISNIADGDITMAGEQTFTSSVSEIFGLAWSKTSAVGVGLYENSSKIYAFAFTSNGSSFTFGSALEVCNGTGGVGVTWDSAANKFLVVVGQSADGPGDRPDAYVLSHSGTTLSKGARLEIESSANMYRYGGLAYDEDNNKHLWTYRDNADSGKLAARIITVSGTSATAGTEVVSASSDIDEARPAYIGNGKFVVAYEKASDIFARVITVSGTTPTFGAESSKIDDMVASGTPGHMLSITYDRTGKVFVGYIPAEWGSEFRILTIDTSANTISAISSETSIGSARELDGYYDSSSQMHIWAMEKSDSHGYYRTAVTSDETTNATTENYIGIAAGTFSSGATATIDVSGATNSSQSSLTAGQKYFVQKDGSLGLTATTPAVFAGTAIAATKLIVNDQQPMPVDTGGWETLIKNNFTIDSSHNGNGNSHTITEVLNTTYAKYNFLKLIIFAYVDNGDIDEMGVQHLFDNDNNQYRNSHYCSQSFAGSNGSDHGAARSTSSNHAVFKRMSADNHHCEAVLSLPQESGIAKVWNVTNMGWRNVLGSDDQHVAHVMSGHKTVTNPLKGIRFYFGSIGGSNSGKCFYRLLGMT